MKRKCAVSSTQASDQVAGADSRLARTRQAAGGWGDSARGDFPLRRVTMTSPLIDPEIVITDGSRGGFFSRLLKASSVHRNRLEDFLTEVLGEILSKLAKNPEHLLWFCSTFLLHKTDSYKLALWNNWAKSFGSIVVRTQHRIEIITGTIKRPDIVVFGDGKPIAIIECKVGAGFTSSEIDSPSGRQTISQLEWYGSWLRSYGSSDAALIVLTQYSDPPEDFLVNPKFGVNLRNIRRWSDLYRFFSSPPADSVARSDDAFAAIRPILNYLIELMTENELMTSDITAADVAAARIYLGARSHWRLIQCVNEASKALKPLLKQKKFSRLEGGVDVREEEDEVYIIDWKSLGNVELGWGFWFSTDDITAWSREFDPAWTLVEGAFVYVEFAKLPRRPKGTDFKNWIFPLSDNVGYAVFRALPFADFLGTNGTTNLVAGWFAEGVREALKLIDAIEP